MIVDPIVFDIAIGGAIALGGTYILGKYRAALIAKLKGVSANIEEYAAQVQEAFPQFKGLVEEAREFVAYVREVVADGTVTIPEAMGLLREGKELLAELLDVCSGLVLKK